MTDIEAVERFRHLHELCASNPPDAGLHWAEMLELAPRLYLILLDGLTYREEDKCGLDPREGYLEFKRPVQ